MKREVETKDARKKEERKCRRAKKDGKLREIEGKTKKSGTQGETLVEKERRKKRANRSRTRRL